MTAPLTPSDCDLRDCGFMPLDVSRLTRSKAWLQAKRSPAIGFYMMNLWVRSWHEVPAASIEDDDDVLAETAMCDPKRWPAIKAKVLHGWIKCADGRLYHPVVAEKAIEAWTAKCARNAKVKKYREGQSTKGLKSATRRLKTKDNFQPNSTELQPSFNRASTGVQPTSSSSGSSGGSSSSGPVLKESSLLPESCTEPKAASVPEDEVLSLPTNKTGDEFSIRRAVLEEFSRLYQGVDVLQELRAMRGWLLANEKKRKTSSGMLRFVNAWLAKAQNQGGSGLAGKVSTDGRSDAHRERIEWLKSYAFDGRWQSNKSGNGVWADPLGIGPPPHDPKTQVTDADLDLIPKARAKRAEKMAQAARTAAPP